MSAKILFVLGIFLVIVGLLYPLGIVETVIMKYLLFTGIIVLGIGIIYLPGRHET